MPSWPRPGSLEGERPRRYDPHGVVLDDVAKRFVGEHGIATVVVEARFRVFQGASPIALCSLHSRRERDFTGRGEGGAHPGDILGNVDVPVEIRVSDKNFHHLSRVGRVVPSIPKLHGVAEPTLRAVVTQQSG